MVNLCITRAFRLHCPLSSGFSLLFPPPPPLPLTVYGPLNFAYKPIYQQKTAPVKRSLPESWKLSEVKIISSHARNLATKQDLGILSIFQICDPGPFNKGVQPPTPTLLSPRDHN